MHREPSMDPSAAPRGDGPAWSVFVFAPMVYDAVHARKHAMAGAAAALGFQSVYVEPPNSHSVHSAGRRGPSLCVRGSLASGADGVLVLSVPKKWRVGPLRFGPGRRFMERVQGRWLARTFASLDIGGRRKLGIVTTARWEPLLRDVDFDALVFDKNDEPPILRGWLGTEEYLEREARLLARSDLLISPSRSLLRAGLAERPGIASRLIRNGVEWEAFRERCGAPVPELEGVRGPIVGFVGSLGSFIDKELIVEAARAHPEFHFPVVGPVPSSADVSALEALPNVRLWGRVPFERVPSIMNRFDACLVPFRPGPISESACPVKFFEYLSLGKPIVCTPMPELEDLSDLVYMTRDGFVEAVGRAARESDPALVARRREAGRRFGWDRLFLDLARALPVLGIA